MKYCCIINGFWQPTNLLWQVEQYIHQFKAHGATLDIMSTTELFVRLESGDVKCDLGDYDGVLFLDKDVAIAHMLEISGYRLFNSAAAIEVCDDKFKTYLALVGKNIDMPNTISSPLLYAGQDDETFCQRVADSLGFPLVVKENYGSFGKQVYLAHNLDKLKDLRKQLLYKPHLYQKFVSDSAGNDMRILVVGGRVLCAMQRSNVNDFRSNIELGGIGTCIVPSNEYLSVAIKVANTLKLDYCGIDLLKGKGNQPILCEVNSNAYFNTISKICNVDVAKVYVEHILACK